MIEFIAAIAFSPLNKTTLAEPFLVLASGKPIEVEIGHADPLWIDMTGDKLPDLLVGQFGNGFLRLYPNRGSAGAPEFKDFTYVQADGKNMSVESG